MDILQAAVVMLQGLVQILDFLCTPTEWPPFQDHYGGFPENSKPSSLPLRAAFLELHALPSPPLRCLLTRSLLVELESARITLLPSFLTSFGASPGTDTHATYMEEFALYTEKAQKIISTFVEDALSNPKLLSKEAIAALKDMENKFLWIFKGPEGILQETAVDFQTRPPILTPKLIEILTNLMDQQRGAWAEVSTQLLLNEHRSTLCPVQSRPARMPDSSFCCYKL